MTSCMIWRPAGFRYLLRGEFLGVGNLGPRSPLILILILPRVSRCLLGARALLHTSWRQRERARQRESETEREREGGEEGNKDQVISTTRHLEEQYSVTDTCGGGGGVIIIRCSRNTRTPTVCVAAPDPHSISTSPN